MVSFSFDPPIHEMVSGAVEQLGLELIEIKYRMGRNTVGVEIFVDRPTGGITVDECSVLNRRVSDWLEENPVIQGDYTVEVASPGLDRPLKTKKDFCRAVNREVRFHLNQMIENKIEHVGIVKEVDEEKVLIKVKEKTMAIPLMAIQKAVQII